jgi:hypothetical protein
MQSSSECKNDLISELNLEIEKEKTNEETILYEKKKEDYQLANGNLISCHP